MGEQPLHLLTPFPPHLLTSSPLTQVNNHFTDFELDSDMMELLDSFESRLEQAKMQVRLFLPLLLPLFLIFPFLFSFSLSLSLFSSFSYFSIFFSPSILFFLFYLLVLLAIFLPSSPHSRPYFSDPPPRLSSSPRCPPKSSPDPMYSSLLDTSFLTA